MNLALHMTWWIILLQEMSCGLKLNFKSKDVEKLNFQ